MRMIELDRELSKSIMRHRRKELDNPRNRGIRFNEAVFLALAYADWTGAHHAGIWFLIAILFIYEILDLASWLGKKSAQGILWLWRKFHAEIKDADKETL